MVQANANPNASRIGFRRLRLSRRLYVVLLHLCVALVLWKSDFVTRAGGRLGWPTPIEQTSHYQDMLAYHQRSVQVVPRGSIIFLGDSLTQGLCVAAVGNPAVNYGIGRDTTSGLLQRLHLYGPALARASAIVLAIGLNDTKQETDDTIVANFNNILRQLPTDVPVIVSSILPVGDPSRSRRIEGLNKKLAALSVDFANAAFVDNLQSELVDFGDELNGQAGNTGVLRPDCHVGDGVHLNSLGNSYWIKSLRQAIATVQSRQ